MKTSSPKKSEILQRDAEVLRNVAQPVSPEDISSKRISDVLKRMSVALHQEEDGVAIAAPQIGESLRIFLVNEEILKPAQDESKPKTKPKDLIFINPEFVKLSKTKKKMEEGCLSVRWLYGNVLRSEKATVKAYDEKGKPFQMGASGLLAQIFQHEIDHLDGMLFIDKATDVVDLPPTQKNDTLKHEPIQL